MEKSKIKILFTIPNFDTAGSGKVLYDLAKHLDKSKFEVHIACSHTRGAFFNEIEKLNLPIHIIETTCQLKPYFKIFGRIKPYKNFIKEHNFDLVHSWHWSSDWTEVIASRLGGAKFIYTKKAMSWGNIHWKIRSYFSNFIITINHEMVQFFPYKKNQKLIPLGLDVDYYNPDLFPTKADDNVFKIITVANLVPVKGIEIIIKAVDNLKNKSLTLTVLGDDRDPYADYLRKMVVEMGLENQIQFLGKKTDVRPFLADSDLYIIPTLNDSRKEGMPMALVEAMSMAIPVIGSNISGINYVLKDFPELLFEAGNYHDLSLKINDLYKKNSIELGKVGKELREYTIKNFTIEKCIHEHEVLYLKLITKKI
ncbi:MAG TPA: glycosyltransferase [Flavobacterium sp.]|uniref:glycosyltransferase n=1 Tax=unclassified Flavobacterium TaxID=196869 RepID=UPI0025C40A19|nr:MULTISPECIES: glycosyltransferase [unclassified Flavobacterium]HRE79343.1 glycosyltransferase [Flavobacterium sp.]